MADLIYSGWCRRVSFIRCIVRSLVTSDRRFLYAVQKVCWVNRSLGAGRMQNRARPARTTAFCK